MCRTLGSTESGMDLPARQRMARESPQFATNICWAVKIATTAVDPVNESIMDLLHPQLDKFNPHEHVVLATRSILSKLIPSAKRKLFSHFGLGAISSVEPVLELLDSSPLATSTLFNSSSIIRCISSRHRLETWYESHEPPLKGLNNSWNWN